MDSGARSSRAPSGHYFRTLMAAAPSASCENICVQSITPRRADGLIVFSGTTTVSPGYSFRWANPPPQAPFTTVLLTTDPLPRMTNSRFLSALVLGPPARFRNSVTSVLGRYTNEFWLNTAPITLTVEGTDGIRNLSPFSSLMSGTVAAPCDSGV